MSLSFKKTCNVAIASAVVGLAQHFAGKEVHQGLYLVKQVGALNMKLQMQHADEEPIKDEEVGVLTDLEYCQWMFEYNYDGLKKLLKDEYNLEVVDDTKIRTLEELLDKNSCRYLGVKYEAHGKIVTQGESRFEELMDSKNRNKFRNELKSVQEKISKGFDESNFMELDPLMSILKKERRQKRRYEDILWKFFTNSFIHKDPRFTKLEEADLRCIWNIRCKATALEDLQEEADLREKKSVKAPNCIMHTDIFPGASEEFVDSRVVFTARGPGTYFLTPGIKHARYVYGSGEQMLSDFIKTGTAEQMYIMKKEVERVLFVTKHPLFIEVQMGLTQYQLNGEPVTLSHMAPPRAALQKYVQDHRIAKCSKGRYDPTSRIFATGGVRMKPISKGLKKKKSKWFSCGSRV